MGWPKIFMARSYHVCEYLGAALRKQHVSISWRDRAHIATRRTHEIVSEWLPHAAAACDIAGDDDRAVVSRPGLATGRHGSRSGPRVRHRATDLRRGRRGARVLTVAAVLRGTRG